MESLLKKVQKVCDWAQQKLFPATRELYPLRSEEEVGQLAPELFEPHEISQRLIENQAILVVRKFLERIGSEASQYQQNVVATAFGRPGFFSPPYEDDLILKEAQRLLQMNGFTSDITTETDISGYGIHGLRRILTAKKNVKHSLSDLTFPQFLP